MLLSIFLIFQSLHLSRSGSLVWTNNGLILGKEAKTIDQEKPYYSFRGIPYAKPPVGELRFKAPVPHDPWIGIRLATFDRDICLQYYNQGSEDCLFINVYTPKASNHSKLLPVMVWLYGGVFLAGDSRYSTFDPDHFLDEDVIFVSMNYRLGVFGFLSTEDEAAYGNWGLKDQLLALQWVNKNIEFFGGDKNKVTIFGQSAGAVSVSLLIQSQLAKGLFQGAIMQSGCSLNLWGLSRKPRNVSFALGAVLGIHTDNSTELTDELRKVDPGKLWLASMAVTAGGMLETVSLSGLIFAPCKEPLHEGAIVLGLSHEKLKYGRFNNVPVIIGFTSQEGLLLNNFMDLIKQYMITFHLLPKKLIPVDLNLSDPKLVLNISNSISRKYFGNDFEDLTKANLIQYTTDDQFVRPINEAARLMAKWVPTFHYRFAFTETGVRHAGELQYMFASTQKINQSDSDILISQRILKLWTNFAKTFTPVPESDPLLDNVQWKTYSEEATFLDFGSSLSMSSNIESYNIPWWRIVFDEYGNPPFDTY